MLQVQITDVTKTNKNYNNFFFSRFVRDPWNTLSKTTRFVCTIALVSMQSPTAEWLFPSPNDVCPFSDQFIARISTANKTPTKNISRITYFTKTRWFGVQPPDTMWEVLGWDWGLFLIFSRCIDHSTRVSGACRVFTAVSWRRLKLFLRFHVSRALGAHVALKSDPNKTTAN